MCFGAISFNQTLLFFYQIQTDIARFKRNLPQFLIPPTADSSENTIYEYSLNKYNLMKSEKKSVDWFNEQQ